MNEPIINLPKFVFLCGEAEKNGQVQLATAITDLSPGYTICDLKTPLRDATNHLFFEDHNPYLPEGALEKPLPLLTCKHNNTTGRDFIVTFERFLREYFSKGILGEIAMNKCVDEDYWDGYIFRDCEDYHDIFPFITKFGEDNVLLIYCGKLEKPRGKNVIFLSSTSIEDRIHQIRKDARWLGKSNSSGESSTTLQTELPLFEKGSSEPNT